jgi:hypothetical protein
MRVRRVQAVVLVAALFSGCVRYYKTEDIRARMAKGLRQFDEALAKGLRDFGEKQALCRRHGVTGPEARALILRMEQQLRQLRAHRAELVKLQQDFEALVRGKRRIRSDSPDWEPLQSLKARVEHLDEQVQASGEAYRDATNALGQLIQRGATAR